MASLFSKHMLLYRFISVPITSRIIQSQTLNRTGNCISHARTCTTELLIQKNILPVDREFDRIIDLEQLAKNDIDSSEVLTALTTFQKHCTEKGFDLNEIQKREDFQKLLKILTKHVRNFDITQMLQALKTLSLLQISSSSLIFQTVLQMISHTLNELTLNQIYFLSFLLKQNKETYLSNGILRGLPIVFETQLKWQLDKHDLKEMVESLCYVSSYVKNEQPAKYIINLLNNYNNEIDVHSAIQIIDSLLFLEHLPEGYELLLNRVYKILQEDLGKLHNRRIGRLANGMAEKVLQGHNGFYNNYLLDKLVQIILTENRGLPVGIYVLHQLNKIKHINISLLNYISEAVIENHCKGRYDSMMIASLIRGMAYANYKTNNWVSLKKILHQIDHRKNYSQSKLLYFVYHLMCLEYFDSECVDLVFSDTPNFKKTNDYHLWTYFRLYQSVKTLFKDYNGVLPSQELINEFKARKSLHGQKNYPLLPILQHLIGDSTYVKTNVRTSLEHEIDHVLAIKNKQPAQIKHKIEESQQGNNQVYLEDLIFDHNSEVILLLFIENIKCGRNIPTIMGPHALHNKSLALLPYRVVIVKENIWNSLLEKEKCPYLLQELGLH